MKQKECINPSDSLTIVGDSSEVKGCKNCVIPQILRVPCRGYQATARLRAAVNGGLEIKDNPEYPNSSDYPTIAVCKGNRAIAISIESRTQILKEFRQSGIKIHKQEPSLDDLEHRNQI